MRKILLALSCLALLAPMFMVAVTSSAPYDAWSDLDADGDIDIFDVVKIAGAYGTTGDPGKNVNVTNWPVSEQVTVFFGVTGNTGIGPLDVAGFSQMQLMWIVVGLESTESVTIRVYGWIYNSAHTVGNSFVDREFVITATKSPQGSASFPVPAQEGVNFLVDFGSGTTASVSVAYYLYA